jgi:hypothetical protein
MEARRRPSPATIIATIALFVALGNTAVGQLGDDGGDTARLSAQQKGFADSIPKGSITSKMLASGAVTAPKLGKAAVTGPAIKPQAITENKVQLGGLSGAVLAQGSIGFGQIQPGSLGGSLFQQGGIPGFAIGPHAITAPHIAPDAVETEKIAPEAITGGKISEFGIPGSKFQEASIGSSKIKPGAITSPLIGENEITTAKIQPGAITNPLLGSQAVTGPKVAPLAISSPLIAPQAVGTQQLSNAIPSAQARNSSIVCKANNATSVNHYTSPELFDTANMFPGNGGADYRLTAPVKGIYQVTATQMWAGDGSGGTRYMEFDKRHADNTTVEIVGSNQVVPATVNGEFQQTLTGIYQLDVGQSIEVWTSANSLNGASSNGCGANSTSFGNINQRTSTFTMSYLAPGPS